VDLTFVSFKWRQLGFPTVYTAQHVNRWAAQVRRHHKGEARFLCCTDDPAGIDSSIDIVDIGPDDGLCNPHGAAFPNCYRRLRLWAPDAGAVFGHRFVLMDLDCAVVGNLTPLFTRPEPVVLWRDPGYPRQPYNGGFYMLSAGARPQVWTKFRGRESIASARKYIGSDQAWMALALSHREAVWTEKDGVLSWKKHVRSLRSLPPHARIVFFHGREKPWDVGMPAWAA
jgi:hypothetical protein